MKAIDLKRERPKGSGEPNMRIHKERKMKPKRQMSNRKLGSYSWGDWG